MSEFYRRNYADREAGIAKDTGQAMGDLSDYQIGTGAARTGSAGTGGLGQVLRARDEATATSRRGLQTDLSTDKLAQYDDQMQRTSQGLSAAAQGANILQGQQAVFDPYKATGVGATESAGATGSLGASSTGYREAASLPGKYSWLAGLAGSALGAAGSAMAPGGGLSQIWKKRPARIG